MPTDQGPAANAGHTPEALRLLQAQTGAVGAIGNGFAGELIAALVMPQIIPDMVAKAERFLPRVVNLTRSLVAFTQPNKPTPYVLPFSPREFATLLAMAAAYKAMIERVDAADLDAGQTASALSRGLARPFVKLDEIDAFIMDLAAVAAEQDVETV